MTKKTRVVLSLERPNTALATAWGSYCQWLTLSIVILLWWGPANSSSLAEPGRRRLVAIFLCQRLTYAECLLGVPHAFRFCIQRFTDFSICSVSPRAALFRCLTIKCCDNWFWPPAQTKWQNASRTTFDMEMARQMPGTQIPRFEGENRVKWEKSGRYMVEYVAHSCSWHNNWAKYKKKDRQRKPANMFWAG